MIVPVILDTMKAIKDAMNVIILAKNVQGLPQIVLLVKLQLIEIPTLVNVILDFMMIILAVKLAHINVLLAKILALIA